MDRLILRLTPLTAFGTPLLGDTLFGQLCWQIRHQLGETRLRQLLTGYTEGQPFAVISDALPAGYLPRPTLPLSLFATVPNADRKQLKKRQWLPLSQIGQPLSQWLAVCQSESEILKTLAQQQDSPLDTLSLQHPQPHNSINRLTGTTGQGEGFSPYTVLQRWYAPQLPLSCYLLFDAAQITVSELLSALTAIGDSGFGRDASIGLGKFQLEVTAESWPKQANANACLTLAPCAPQGLSMNSTYSFYQTFTRFGRHGDQAVFSGRPFKTPLLLARAGAILMPKHLPDQNFIGQGLGGAGQLSKAIAETVHQGYAPWIPVNLPTETVQ